MRAANVVGAYAVTAAVSIGAVWWINQMPQEEGIRRVLSYVFISVLTGGIEPGTAKVFLLERYDGNNAKTLPFFYILFGAAGKSLIFTPLVYLVAGYLDGTWSGASGVGWLLCITVIGFITTDFRGALDGRGAYVSALWLKQGGVSLGMLGLAFCFYWGSSAEAAMMCGLIVRVVFLMLILLAVKGEFAFEWGSIAGLGQAITTGRWVHFAGASGFSVLGGSVDRIVAFRCLDGVEIGAYYLIYEVLSKFWVLPYLLTPVVFSERVRHLENGAVFRMAVWTTGVAGAGFLTVVWLAWTWVVRGGLDLALSSVEFAAVAYVSTGVVATSFSMIMLSDLQGRGFTQSVMVLSAVSVALSVGLFWSLVDMYGGKGLYLAWIYKSFGEFFLIVGAYKVLVRGEE